MREIQFLELHGAVCKLDFLVEIVFDGPGHRLVEIESSTNWLNNTIDAGHIVGGTCCQFRLGQWHWVDSTS